MTHTSSPQLPVGHQTQEIDSPGPQPFHGHHASFSPKLTSPKLTKRIGMRAKSTVARRGIRLGRTANRISDFFMTSTSFLSVGDTVSPVLRSLSLYPVQRLKSGLVTVLFSAGREQVSLSGLGQWNWRGMDIGGAYPFVSNSLDRAGVRRASKVRLSILTARCNRILTLAWVT